MKHEFFQRSKIPPYLTADDAVHESENGSNHLGRSSSAIDENVKVSKVQLTKMTPENFSGEADIAAGSHKMEVPITRNLCSRTSSYTSLARLRTSFSPPKQPSSPLKVSFIRQNNDQGRTHIIEPTWRLRERVKTVGVCLVLALNIGTDPPDITRVSPCAKLLCWVDPTSMSRAKAREKIGENLETQYSKWQQRAKLRYKRLLDPTVEDVRSLCTTMRRHAKSERLLLHYNGHGVPRPTSNGEIWVFDKNHTQYIPLSVGDLRQWMDKPAILVLDCSGAGILMPFLLEEARVVASQDSASVSMFSSSSSIPSSECIVLAPCGEGEWLPQNSEFPADVFTSCLTTPIPIALRWFVNQNPLSMGNLSAEQVDKIPGQLNDRKTPLGELNWIFAAVTDTIAWNVLPSPLFQRLFRQDLLVAGLFRNFLLANRILRSLNCTPVSNPALPNTEHHPLWQAWDLAVETCLCGLLKQGLLTKDSDERRSSGDRVEELSTKNASVSTAPSFLSQKSNSVISFLPSAGLNLTSPFFSEQLTAFEVWLEFASTRDDSAPMESPPEQLPVVLQVLLSQSHRVRALMLLNRFLDLGPWAVNLALSVGIFPYVLKLLNSHVDEYKHVLIGIWAKILSFDPSCQVDLVKDGALPHFIAHLNWGLGVSKVKESSKDDALQRIMAAFILSVICLDYSLGQTECLRQNLHGCCAGLLATVEAGEEEYMLDEDEQLVTPEFRMWICICLGSLSKQCNTAQGEIYGSGIHTRIFKRLEDNCPDVRAAAAYALGCLIGREKVEDTSFIIDPRIASLSILSPTNISLTSQPQQDDHPNISNSTSFTSNTKSSLFEENRFAFDIVTGKRLSGAANDASPTVRYEAIVALACLVDKYLHAFIALASKDASISTKNDAKKSALSSTKKDTKKLTLTKKDSSKKDLKKIRNDTEKYCQTISLPTKLDREKAAQLYKVWSCLRHLQRHDPHNGVSAAADSIVSFVNEQIFLLKTKLCNVLHFSKEEKMPSDSKYLSLAMSMTSNNPVSPSLLSQSLHENSAVESIIHPNSPVSSSMATATSHNASIDNSTSVSSSITREYSLPVSKFYTWKCRKFTLFLKNRSQNADLMEDDFLSPMGAMKAYRDLRDEYVLDKSLVLKEKYKCLVPNSPKKKKDSFVDDFMDDEQIAAIAALEEETAEKKRSLQLSQSTMLKNEGVETTSMLCFHAYEPALIVCDRSDGISVWDIRKSARVNIFRNGNPKNSRITSVSWLNEESSSLLLTSSDDGTLRVWDGIIEDSGELSQVNPRLSTAFVAAPELEAGQRGSGLVIEWQQYNGRLITAGNGPLIRCWDFDAEKCYLHLDRKSDACVTTLTTAWDSNAISSGIGPNIIVAGYGNGAMKVFDIRSNHRGPSASLKEDGRRFQGKAVNERVQRGRYRAKLSQYAEHRSWIVDMFFTSYGAGYEIVSGCVAGDIKFWDLRMLHSLRTIDIQRSQMTALAIHKRVPLIATGSQAQFIKILTLDGDTLDVIRYHDEFNRRIGPVSCLAFHPHKLLLAAGATDEIVQIYKA